MQILHFELNFFLDHTNKQTKQKKKEKKTRQFYNDSEMLLDLI